MCATKIDDNFLSKLYPIAPTCELFSEYLMLIFPLSVSKALLHLVHTKDLMIELYFRCSFKVKVICYSFHICHREKFYCSDILIFYHASLKGIHLLKFSFRRMKRNLLLTYKPFKQRVYAILIIEFSLLNS